MSQQCAIKLFMAKYGQHVKRGDSSFLLSITEGSFVMLDSGTLVQ